MEWSGAERGLNCVPPAKKKGIRSGLPLPLTYSTMGHGTPGSFPPQALPEAAPRGNRSRGCSTPNRTRPPTTTSYWVRPAAPAVAPKTNNFTALVSFFNQKQQEKTRNVPTRRRRPQQPSRRRPPRPHFQTPTNYHQKTKETTRPTERNVYYG